MEEQGVTRKPRKMYKRLAWGTAVALGAGLLVSIGIPLSSGLFPSETLTSCTITEKPFETRNRRSGTFFPRVYTDCGTFRSAKQATCTADPSLKTAFIPGRSYDLVVRGAHLPISASREIVSATALPKQATEARTPLKRLEPNTGDEQLDEIIDGIRNSPESREVDEKIAQLEAEFSPEVLRAFDYEQPAFNPKCDVIRQVMTSKGLQVMDAPRATEVLTPPAGTTPRSPLLPCKGFECNPSITP